MKKFGPTLGIVVCAIAIVASLHLPSCSLTAEQQAQLRSISVPAAGILSKAAISQGWLEPGDEVTIQRGVAVVASEQSREVKLYQLAELGLDEALKKGLLTTSDAVTVDTPTQVTITTPGTGAEGAGAKETLPDILPPAGG